MGTIRYAKKGRDLSIPELAQQLLREQIIEGDGPGTVLKDFETLLQFVGDDGLKTTSKYYLLPQGTLQELNLQMSHPIMHRLKRPQQRSFPHLHGLFLMLRASSMGLGEGTPPNGRLVLEQEAVASWRGLNPTERYFALLEAWLVQGIPDLIAEHSGRFNGCIDVLSNLTRQLSERRTLCDARWEILYDTMRTTTAALMELFGWIQLEYRKPAASKGVQVSAIVRTDFGDAMVSALDFHGVRDELRMFHEDIAPDPGVLIPLFQSYFPEYQRTMSVKEPLYLEGTHVYRVALGDAWRRIAAPDDSTLDELAHTIIDAFEFDMDHLYCFDLQQPNGRKLRIACPLEREAAAFTDDVTLGQLPIAEVGAMEMIFDYGDSWVFKIQLEKIEPAITSDQPQVVAKGGTPPAQYPEQEEDGFYDDDD